MSQQHQESYHRTLIVLSSRLETIISILAPPWNHDESILPLSTETSDRRKRKSLDEAVEGLETWQRMSEHLWFLLMRISNPDIDAALATDDTSTMVSAKSISAIRAGLNKTLPPTEGSALSLDYGFLASMAVKDLAFSEAKIAKQMQPSGEDSSYILYEVTIPPPDAGSGKYKRKMTKKRGTVKKETGELVRRLQHEDPETFGLLACQGFCMDPVHLKFMVPVHLKLTLMFRIPPGLGNPRSLREQLLNTKRPSSLTQRFDLAKDLANSVGYVHTFGFVHKNIRPESVLSFRSGEGRRPFSTFLIGLDTFRREEAFTLRIGDSFIEKNLYRHPSRQGLSPTREYAMQHDIYSLGVCLLELGLWKSFIKYPVIDGVTTPQWSSILGMPADLDPLQTVLYLSSDAKERLVSLAREKLPQYMGTRYTDIVVNCLTCLDPDNEDFGDEKEFQDGDGIGIGVRYIEKVIRWFLGLSTWSLFADPI